MRRPRLIVPIAAMVAVAAGLFVVFGWGRGHAETRERKLPIASHGTELHRENGKLVRRTWSHEETGDRSHTVDR